jgi:CheY-like chemotaxis protein
VKQGTKRLRILLVEDNPVNQQLAAQLLITQGHTVTVTANGPEALAALGLAEEPGPSAVPFDLVLLDLQMPGLDGFETAARIRVAEHRTGRQVPIIALTTRAQGDARQQCLAAGMNGCLGKPIRPVELARVLAQLTRPARAKRARVPVPSTPKREVLDAGALLVRVNHDVDLLREIVGSFRNQCPRLMVELRQAVTGQDAPAVEQAAHILQSSASHLNAQMTFEAARKLEALGQASDLQGAAAVLESLETNLQRLQAALEGLVPAVAFS